MNLIATTFLLTLGMLFFALPSKVEKTYEIKQNPELTVDSIPSDTFCIDAEPEEKLVVLTQPMFRNVSTGFRTPLPIMDSLEEKQIRQVIDSCYKGADYLWGSKDCQGSLDCSGFVKCLLSSFGIVLPDGSYNMKDSVILIPKERIRPGDLVFWELNGKVHHVGVIVKGNPDATFVDISPTLGVNERELIKAGYKPGHELSYGRVKEPMTMPPDLSDSNIRRDFFTYCLRHAGSNKDDWPYHMIAIINQSNDLGGWEKWKEYRTSSSRKNSIRDRYYLSGEATELVEKNFEQLNDIFNKVIQGHFGPNNIYFFEGKGEGYKFPYHLEINERKPYEENKDFNTRYYIK